MWLVANKFALETCIEHYAAVIFIIWSDLCILVRRCAANTIYFMSVGVCFVIMTNCFSNFVCTHGKVQTSVTSLLKQTCPTAPFQCNMFYSPNFFILILSLLLFMLIFICVVSEVSYRFYIQLCNPEISFIKYIILHCRSS